MEIIPKILIYWFIIVFISTEVLSYFNFLNRFSILLVNTCFIFSILGLYHEKVKILLKKLWQKHNISSYIIALLLFFTFLQGFFSAPNTTDSMVYHLPRVMYWMQEKTLYQDVIRNDHDFMAPFAEYLVLHLYLIFNGDNMLFLSQWLAFAVSIVLSFLIAKELGVEERAAKLIALFIASLPIAVLQSSSTQTDIITTVMVLFSVYFALLLRKTPNLQNSILFGFSIGLGILTKAPFVLYMFIPLVILLVGVLKKWKQYLPLAFLIIFIIGITQLRFLNQNLNLYGNISGQRLDGGYVNEVINPQSILSNSIDRKSVV